MSARFVGFEVAQKLIIDPKTVLLVENEDQVRKILSKFWRKGYHVLSRTVKKPGDLTSA